MTSVRHGSSQISTIREQGFTEMSQDVEPGFKSRDVESGFKSRDVESGFKSRDVESGFKSDVKSMGDIVGDFASGTSAHGLPLLAKMNGKPTRLFWICICIASFGVLVLQVVLLARRYFETPKHTVTEVQNEAIPFPIVSVCNLQSLDIAELEKSYMQLLQNYSFIVSDTLDHIYQFETAWRSNDSMHSVPKHESFTGMVIEYMALNYILVQHFANLNNSVDEIRYLQTQLLSPETFYGSYGHKLVTPYGTKKEQFIARCRFQYRECDHTNFETLASPFFYNCFSFNASTILGNDTKTYFTGPYGGLSLQLFAPTVDILHHLPDRIRHQVGSTYNPILSGGGIRVLVHGPDEWPDISNKGIDIPSGFSGSMILSVQKYQRLKSDGQCIAISDIVRHTNHSQYSETGCRSYCIQTYIRSTCNCTHPSFAHLNFESHPICAALPELSLRCYHPSIVKNISKDQDCTSFLDRFVERLLCQKTVVSHTHLLAHLSTCSCLPLCTEYKYTTQVSLSQWPTSLDKSVMLTDILTGGFLEHFDEEQREMYFSRISQRNVNDQSVDLSANQSEFISEGHFIRLNVYFADTTVVTIREQPSYDIMQVISDIGGQMGLWMGLSIITIAEVLWLVFTICGNTVSSSKVATPRYNE